MQAFLQRINELEPDAVFLFGSLARGDYLDTSDADLLVLFAQPIPYPEVDRRACGNLHILVETWENVWRQVHEGEPFYLEILLEGCLLAEREGRGTALIEAARETARARKFQRTPWGWTWSMPSQTQSASEDTP
ncbi:nucleotidyltransferase domain-containing protein [Thermoflexus sp.]|uniref:nucleotidyltransferase domain-containing protein n=1 Tax=Thermoflexus sp. TaxID=1969742 RepID=UPI0029931390|nr:nucleotidyltransferase domain-containing protein [Anaerolineae bacterium]MDW8184569.1 nucleotidyltransferase domain-containing protein [Anaerolineae bacterium]